MTIDFICEELAELFDSPCNYSPVDERMFQDSYCESHCGKITDKECWKQYFEKVWADRKTEIQSEVVNDSQDLVKDLVKAFCEDGTWLERQGVYTLTLAEAKQRAVDIIESVIAKTEPQRTCDNCGTPRDKCVYCIEEDRMWTPQTERKNND